VDGKGISKGIAIFSFFCTCYNGKPLYLLLMQINEFSMNGSHEKTSETVNEISIYISQHFEISTEQQLIFFKNSINNSASQALSCRNAAFYFRTFFLSLIIPVFGSHTIIAKYAMFCTRFFPLKEKKPSAKF
jgi:hypothetical protein